MRTQGPLSATGEKLRGLTASAVIGSAIDTTSNSVTVCWHGPQPAAVNTVVSQALAAGITVNIIDAPFSAAELSQSRSRIRERMQELGISRIDFDADGGGSTVHFRTTADIQAARDALTGYQQRLDRPASNDGDSPAIAVLYSQPGSPAVRVIDQLSKPQDWGTVRYCLPANRAADHDG